MAPKAVLTDTLWIWCLLVDITHCHTGRKSGELFPLCDPPTQPCASPSPSSFNHLLPAEDLQGLEIGHAGAQLGLQWHPVHSVPGSSCTKANTEISEPEAKSSCSSWKNLRKSIYPNRSFNTWRTWGPGEYSCLPEKMQLVQWGFLAAHWCWPAVMGQRVSQNQPASGIPETGEEAQMMTPLGEKEDS